MIILDKCILPLSMASMHHLPSFLSRLDFPRSVSRQLEATQNHSASDEIDANILNSLELQIELIDPSGN